LSLYINTPLPSASVSLRFVVSPATNFTKNPRKITIFVDSFRGGVSTAHERQKKRGESESLRVFIKNVIRKENTTQRSAKRRNLDEIQKTKI